MLCQHDYDPNVHPPVIEQTNVSRVTSSHFGSVASSFIKLSNPIASVHWSTEDMPASPKPKTGRITRIPVPLQSE